MDDGIRSKKCHIVPKTPVITLIMVQTAYRVPLLGIYGTISIWSVMWVETANHADASSPTYSRNVVSGKPGAVQSDPVYPSAVSIS